MNNYFHQQFHRDHQLSSMPKKILTDHRHHINPTKSIEQGELTLDWKTAHVTPVYKSGSHHSACNYRLISLTSIPCKLLEHILLGDIIEKIDWFLHNRQHGFRNGLSCETQLCATIHDILAATDKDQSVHAAVLDFT